MYVYLYNTIKWPYQPKHSPSITVSDIAESGISTSDITRSHSDIIIDHDLSEYDITGSDITVFLITTCMFDITESDITVSDVTMSSLRQIELLTPHQNGTAVDTLEGSTRGGGAHPGAHRASIKGMWKKAFRSLKSHSKDKDDQPAENKTEDRKHVQRTVSRKHFPSLEFFCWPPSVSCSVAVMSADLPSPYRLVHLLACSQSCTFHVSLARIILFSVVMSSFSRYICPQKFPQYVFFFSRDHVSIPVHTIFCNFKETVS